MNGKDDSEGLDVDGRVILKKKLKKKVCECMNWIYLALDRNLWRALVDTNGHFCSIKEGVFLV
jgi:hypothetical protein